MKSTKFYRRLGAAAVALCMAEAFADVANREARVDGEGVMRWTDDGSEVALWGVNYYTPFTVDYAAMKARKLDLKAEIRRDVEHFRRLGLDSIRIHCFDRQFSGPNGEFVDNEHVELLDYLIARAAAEGIYMVLTPIAWWGGSYAPDEKGFSNRFTMREMTTKREAWTCQAKFLKAFAEHVNRFTKRRYADDSAVVAFELINEPLYPPETPDEKVVEYVNVLADALRSSGTTKPIFYNCWQKRQAALSKARVDGVTGSYYPTGLVAGHALAGPQLGKVQASTLAPTERIAKRARMIYEFDAADTPGTYMYPALARLFRHEGVQVANMFQYDPLAVAPYNRGWRTHFLNLAYAPGKALSFAIAGEAFRRWPRGCDYAADPQALRYGPYRVDADEDLSEFAADDAFLYTNDTATRPPKPENLARVWGCGSSPVVASTGNGAYFFDRIGEGFWNVQLYPSVATVRDVYSGGEKLKKVTSLDELRITVRLPDLGETWSAWANGVFMGRAKGGILRLGPGEYAFTRGERLPGDWRRRIAARGLARFVAPLGDGYWQPPANCERPEEFNLFDVGRAMSAWCRGSWRQQTKDETGRPAYRMWAHGGFTETMNWTNLKFEADARELFRRFPDLNTAGRDLVLHIRGTLPETKRIEVVMTDEDGIPWGMILPISADWRDVTVPLASLRLFRHWMNGAEAPAGAKPDFGRMRTLSLGFGTYLLKDTARLEHGIEFSCVRLK